ncbi:MAG TPA: flagellar basal body-associated FliL family protein [Gallionella sp.]|nr:flagellar basal body-associated FliL family protein [Gallionella sp.]
MAKGTKPGAKPEEQEEVAPPQKSKKKLIIIIVAAVLVIGAAAVAAVLLLKPAHPRQSETEETTSEHKVEDSKFPAKFIDVGTFTTNLAPDEGDRFVQTAITFKISKPELEEKISATRPELQHRINMLLQSKLPSELAASEGKTQLAAQIKLQAEEVLGLRKATPTAGAEPAAGGPVAAKPQAGLDEVLFTSFLIQ